MTTTTLLAGWAVVSKEPGTYNDYGILRSSRGPCPPSSVLQYALTRSPGNSPSLDVAAPAGLPWVWFTPVKADDGRYLGVAIRRWTTEVDATDRPIASNLFVYVPVDEFLASGCGFAGLFAAAHKAPLPIDDIDPCASERLELTVSPVESAVDSLNIDESALLSAAAAVLDGPVKLHGGPTDLLERMQVLDAVACLLPAGARVWLSAAGWAESAAEPVPRLAFARAARAGDAVVNLRTGSGEGRALKSDAAKYRKTLIAMREDRGREAVAQHLRRQTRTWEKSPTAALVALNDMRLADIVLQHARASELTASEFRRLGVAGMRVYTDAELREAVVAYMRIATVTDLIQDTPMLVCEEIWPFAADEVVPAMAGGLRIAPTAQSIQQLSAIATALGDLSLLADTLDNSESGVLTAPSVPTGIVELARDPVWAPVLAPYLAGSIDAAIEVARALYLNGDNRLAAVATELNVIAAPESAWHTVGDILRKIMTGDATPAEIDELLRHRSDLISEVLGIIGQQDYGNVAPILSRMLPRLIQNLGAGLPPQVLRAVSTLDVVGPIQQAQVDYVLCCHGERPKHPLSTSEEYRRAFVEAANAVTLPPDRQALFISWVVAGLARGWTAQSPAPVLDTLWDLVHTDHGRPVGVQYVASAINQDIYHNGHSVLGDPAIRRWDSVFADDAVLGPLLVHRRIDVPADQVSSVVEVAQAIAQARLPPIAISIIALVERLRRAQWFARSPSTLLDLATTVTAAQAGRSNPHDFGVALITAWIGPDARPLDRPIMTDMALRIHRQHRLNEELSKLLEPHIKGPNLAMRAIGRFVTVQPAEQAQRNGGKRLTSARSDKQVSSGDLAIALAVRRSKQGPAAIPAIIERVWRDGWFARSPEELLDLATLVTEQTATVPIGFDVGVALIRHWTGPAGGPPDQADLNDMANRVQAQRELTKSLIKELKTRKFNVIEPAAQTGNAARRRSQQVPRSHPEEGGHGRP
ncbi:hypothetical protein [Nocardia salmonicida]|uniref:hypothetical protein n=1 Tax=Nocardia salmonicida TaxID=53431 RepID=UPI0033F93D4E